MKESYETPKVEEIDLEETFSFGMARGYSAPWIFNAIIFKATEILKGVYQMKESYEKPKAEEIDLEESFSFGVPPPVSPFQWAFGCTK